MMKKKLWGKWEERTSKEEKMKTKSIITVKTGPLHQVQPILSNDKAEVHKVERSLISFPPWSLIFFPTRKINFPN